jgi:FixJ family two-component response regulator
MQNTNPTESPMIVFVVDDDPLAIRFSEHWLRSAGYQTRSFVDTASALAAIQESPPACVVLDLAVGQDCGNQLLQDLHDQKIPVRSVLLTGTAVVETAVRAMKLGAVDVLLKPAMPETLLEAVALACRKQSVAIETRQSQSECRARLETLSPREDEVARLIVAGHSNKQAARALNISSRTVEIHRARVMNKTGSDSFAQLVQLFERAA